jgi:tetratricopeptide (TPR) repeat protein
LEVRETLAELREIPKLENGAIERNIVLKAEQKAYFLLKQIETPYICYGEEMLIINDFQPYIPEDRLITAMTKIIENLNLFEYEPTKAKILINVGTIFYKLGNKETAQTFFNQAKKIVIENRDENGLGFTEAYDGRFVAQLALDQKDKALFGELLDVFLELAPSQWKNGFKAKLATKLYEFGQKERARKIYHETINGLGTNDFYEGNAEEWYQVLGQQPKINGNSEKEAIKSKILQALEETMNKMDLENGQNDEFCFNLAAIAKAHIYSKVELENKDDEILKKIVNTLKPLDKTLAKWLN